MIDKEVILCGFSFFLLRYGTLLVAESLQNEFSDVSRNFNVVYINVQSILILCPNLIASFDCNLIKCWLKPCLPSSSYSLPGFNWNRNYCTVGAGGEVVIYLRNHISYRIIEVITTTTNPWRWIYFSRNRIKAKHFFYNLLFSFSPIFFLFSLQ